MANDDCDPLLCQARAVLSVVEDAGLTAGDQAPVFLYALRWTRLEIKLAIHSNEMNEMKQKIRTIAPDGKSAIAIRSSFGSGYGIWK